MAVREGMKERVYEDFDSFISAEIDLLEDYDEDDVVVVG